MLEPIEVILYGLLLVLGIGAAMVVAVLVLNAPSKRARAARRRKY
jgi:prolipoprotein diacylglyceryltransferase